MKREIKMFLSDSKRWLNERKQTETRDVEKSVKSAFAGAEITVPDRFPNQRRLDE